MALVNANKPESLKILITVTLMVEDELRGNKDAAIILHAAYLISQPVVPYNLTLPNFS